MCTIYEILKKSCCSVVRSLFYYCASTSLKPSVAKMLRGNLSLFIYCVILHKNEEVENEKEEKMKTILRPDLVKRTPDCLSGTLRKVLVEIIKAQKIRKS